MFNCCCLCSYPLTFTPPGSGNFSGTLELLLNPTGEKLQYTLNGKASEPLAEGHVLVECQVSYTSIPLNARAVTSSMITSTCLDTLIFSATLNSTTHAPTHSPTPDVCPAA